MQIVNQGNNMTNLNKSWTTTIDADPDDPECLILTFPDEILDELGWSAGDVLVWDIHDDGTVTIRKKD